MRKEVSSSVLVIMVRGKSLSLQGSAWEVSGLEGHGARKADLIWGVFAAGMVLVYSLLFVTLPCAVVLV